MALERFAVRAEDQQGSVTVRSEKGSRELMGLATSFFGIGLHWPSDLGWELGETSENYFSLYNAAQGRILVESHEEGSGYSWSHCEGGIDSNLGLPLRGHLDPDHVAS